MKNWWRGHRGRLLQLWGVGIACSLLVTGASAMGYLEFLQAPTLDLMLRVQGQRFASGVVIVAIDEAAFEALGRRQPLVEGVSGPAAARSAAARRWWAWTWC